MKDFKYTQNEFVVGRRTPASPPENLDAEYTARRGPRFELAREEIDILRQLSDAVDERTSPDALPEERQAAVAEMVEEDAELAALARRLEELSQANDESILLALESLDRKEEERDEDGA
jgi:hypothetical protein